MKKEHKKIQGEISFVFNVEKSIHVILYIIQQSKGKINQHNLWRIVFEADKYHLNKYGIPIPGDTYRNMSFGPVPSAIYNMVKGHHMPRGSKSPKEYLQEMGMTKPPFKYNRDTRILSSSIPHDPKRFTKTNVEALNQAIKKYGELSFDELKQANCRERSWRETERNQLIPFELIVENKTTLGLLSEHPYGIVVL